MMLRGIEVEEFPFRVAPIFENSILTRSMTRGGVEIAIPEIYSIRFFCGTRGENGLAS